MKTIYISIGSNLDQPIQHVRTAIRELGQYDRFTLLASSSLYRSSPLGPEDQPDYINAVIAIKTDLGEHAVLDALQALESRHGRVRDGERWGPRTLDLDVLLVDDKIINTDRLIIPHPGLHERSFVLYPLQEIAPGLSIPGHGSIDELIAQCDHEGLERISQV
jgi:2-amino-4-hydroxy-6-hydroxymethyldihydropteridine diphosphokinase